jgi:hypothetical protein
MRGMYVGIPILCKGRNRIHIQTKSKILNVASKPTFHVLSNGALAFAGSLIFCRDKGIKLITEAMLALNLHFQPIGLNKCTIRKRTKFWF